MTFTPTADIFRRVRAAMEYDLLGETTADAEADEDVNGHLSSPLNSQAVVNYVERYLLDPQGAGYLFVANEMFGLTAGYSFNTQSPSAPTGGTGQSHTHTLPIEVSVIGVVQSFRDIQGGIRARQIDDVMDDLMRIFQGGRRNATHFGGSDLQTVTLGPGSQLEGGTADAPFAGRTMQIDFRRDFRALQ